MLFQTWGVMRASSSDWLRETSQLYKVAPQIHDSESGVLYLVLEDGTCPPIPGLRQVSEVGVGVYCKCSDVAW